MRKKILLITLLILAFFILFMIPNIVNAAEPTYDPNNGYVLNGSQKCFFANGTEITITARQDGGDGATITWEGGHTNVPSDVSVFGGAHADPATYDTKVIMNGGTVKNLFGGGLHESYVGTAEVIMNAGTVTGSVSGGGANVFANSDNCAPTAENATGSATRVVNANVIINGGTIGKNLFGGGEGLSFTKTTSVAVNGGSTQYVTAGGSNGYTGNAELYVTGGTVGILQSVNRGEMESANLEVSGGTIEKLYVGGETDPSVTGSISTVTLDITGSVKVNNLFMGTSGGETIGTNGNDTAVFVAIHDGADVTIANPDEFENVTIINYVYVTIDETKYELEKGKTLSDFDPDELSAIKNAQGKEFVKFVKKGTSEDFSETTPINTDIELSTVFTDKVTPNEPAKDPTPKTGTNNILTISLLVVAILSLAGFVVTKKSMR